MVLTGLWNRGTLRKKLCGRYHILKLYKIVRIIFLFLLPTSFPNSCRGQRELSWYCELPTRRFRCYGSAGPRQCVRGARTFCALSARTGSWCLVLAGREGGEEGRWAFETPEDAGRPAQEHGQARQVVGSVALPRRSYPFALRSSRPTACQADAAEAAPACLSLPQPSAVLEPWRATAAAGLC